MSANNFPTAPSLDLTVRVGCALSYETSMATPILLAFRPGLDRGQLIREEKLVFGPGQPTEQLTDTHGNLIYRSMLQPGRNEFLHDAVFSVPSAPDNDGLPTHAVALECLPVSVLRYTLPSRYCDSDRLLNFAWEKFAQAPHGVERVRAICAWVHHNIEYRYGSGSPNISACNVVERGYGVCRDLAHVGVALCRAFSLPARYVSGHVADIGVVDPGLTMDFHAYFEVFLGGVWHTFDARYNTPRIGRIKIAHGMDAVDAAFATIYGEARLTHFEVWAYQIARSEVSIGDPVDLARRLDGKAELQLRA
ncbi:MAG: transglutaminase-like domain-containing protein [Burkholderiales bacterium]|nr:transglutaminase family protein [Burkholderiales bacterium]